MQHEEHSSAPSRRFGTNTNGFGILIVALVAVFLALFCWNFWKSGSKEIHLYRMDTVIDETHGHEHSEGAHPEASESAAPLSLGSDSLHESSHSMDSSAHAASDSTHGE